MTREATRAGDAGVSGTASTSAETITAAAGAKAAAENFPVALRLLPGRYRRHLAAVYGFARVADDMGDEAPPGERLRLLDELAADLDRLYAPGGPGLAGADRRAGGSLDDWVAGDRESGDRESGRADGPRLAVIRALGPAVTECAIPQQPFRDLIQANRQDQVVTRYGSFAELVGYCELSANPVGRIVLHVFGVSTPAREALSDHVCTALQLAEHWQDVAEDLHGGRVYLPREDLDRFGCGEDDLAAPRAAAQVRALMAFQQQRARELLDKGAPLIGSLRGAARAAVAGYVAGGRAALAAIAAADYDVLCATPRPRRRRLAAELVRAYATGR